MDFIFLPKFQPCDQILCQISAFLSGFKNVVSTIELDQRSLACTDTKHRTQNALKLILSSENADSV